MCGLFGWIATGDPKRTRYALLPQLTRHLAAGLETRGRDSLGLAYMRPGLAEPAIAKRIGLATKVLDTLREPIAAACAPGGLWLMGHTRSATIGPVDIDNAHPFRIGRTVGAHNGHVNNHMSLPLKQERSTLPPCDSAALIALVDEREGKDALTEAQGVLNLTYSQAPWTTVTLHKSFASSLYLAYLRAWGLILWASEMELLAHAVATADGCLATAEEEKEGHFVIMPVDSLCPIGAMSIGKALLHWAGEAVKVPTKPTHNYGNYGAWEEGWTGHGNGRSLTMHRKRPKGAAHRSVYCTDYWHDGSLASCPWCKGAPVRETTWVVYRRRNRLLPVTIKGEAWGMPTKCLNCNHYTTLYYLHEGYFCTHCEAWMAMVRSEIVPPCPTTLGERAEQLPLVRVYPNGGADATT